MMRWKRMTRVQRMLLQRHTLSLGGVNHVKHPLFKFHYLPEVPPITRMWLFRSLVL